MITTDVLILGGGLAGLSTAYHLDRLGGSRSSGRGLDYLIVEKEKRPGGAAGSVYKDGFTFDHTGHLLHLHDPYGKKLILSLLRGNWRIHQRSSWIFSRGAFTRYPFQANTFGLPRKVVEDCVVGFMKTVHRPVPLGPCPSFRQWCLSTFGKGISEHFMFPYNEKLWRFSLSKMTTQWQGRFVPKPASEEVLYGAITDQKKFFGYNAAFRYPVTGGIQVLPDALAARVRNLHLDHRLLGIDLREKIASVEHLGEVRYERLVNTLPLSSFLDMASPLPMPVLEARRQLRWNTVYNLNLGIARKVTDKHWIYFPEQKYPFYRVGFASNFSPEVAPRGASSMYVEVSRRPGERPDLRLLEREIVSGLKNAGLLRDSDKLLTKAWLTIPCAYVVYDFNRPRALSRIFEFLSGRGVESIGRYGGWKYSFMEETILDGRRCAQRLLALGGDSAAVSQEELRPLK